MTKVEIGNRSNLFSRVSAIVWALCIGLFIALSVLSSNEIIKELSPSILIADIVVGVIAFFLMAFFAGFSSYIRTLKENDYSFLKLMISFVLFLLFLPFVLIFRRLNPFKFAKSVRKNGLKKLLSDIKKSKRIGHVLLHHFLESFLVTVILLPLWIGGYIGIWYIGGYLLGIKSAPVSVTGQSMMPTLQENDSPDMFSNTQLSRLLMPIRVGDIVTFKNGITKIEDGSIQTFIKRVVATEGNEITIKNGYVYVDGQIQQEPYSLKPRSTYGGTFIKDCESMKVPMGYVFVLGDNRKRSNDSRNLGFISINDIEQHLPLPKQEIYKGKWRDASRDAESATQVSFDKTLYYEQLNKIRLDNKLKPFKTNEKLEKAAQLRADAIIKNKEADIDPNDSVYPPRLALRDAKYSNIVTGEINTRGYYDSEELAAYWLEFNTKEAILNKDYQETGIAASLGQIDGCDIQVIVQEFGGYIPPNYSQSDIQSWESTLNSLKNILPGWENFRNSPRAYASNKDKGERIIELIKIRISRIERILSTMKANKWLSSEEKSFIDQDVVLYNEQQSIAKFLNSLQW